MFHQVAPDLTIAKVYADNYCPSAVYPSPRCLVAVAGVCCEHEGEADALVRGRRNQIVCPTLFGTKAQCRDKILALQDTCATGTFLFLDVSDNEDLRLRSMALLREALI
jgi:alkanesulfonate monooxygenase SsuD/methylene tetrahydromethanopterin reductase-like flavin-dependent oxidoreductase (luciferase family)